MKPRRRRPVHYIADVNWQSSWCGRICMWVATTDLTRVTCKRCLKLSRPIRPYH